MASVAVQLKVLVLVGVATEGVKNRRPEAVVFVERLKLLRLDHQLLDFGVSFWQECVVTFVEERRILIVSVLNIDR